ncbi:developmental protein SEPALLATA 3-like [Panicum virgatum]|uniref:developmental protein SEPALLATA 3-like n=1 Tax=Panicum virgatum TaxID=38727 RepID=UPI0019D54121|nr:developmental protein SEPALLATA 3-like [Panicum virgatum]
MGRPKVSLGLIPNRRQRAGTFGKRKEGLKKKAGELSVLCGVDVALVVAAAGDGSGAADVWESREGVLARYRALGAEARVRHTHRAYLAAELSKWEAKLARVRQGGPDALARWDRALDGIATAEEARRLLDAIDAAMRAAKDRRRALGLPPADDAEDGVVLDGVEPLNFAAAGDLHAPGGDANNDQQAMWDGNGFHFQQGGAAEMQHTGYGFQQYTSGSGAGVEGYQQQMAPDMYSSGDHNNGHLAHAYQQYQPRDPMQHGYGFQCAHDSCFDANASYAQLSLPMWSADEPRHDMLPLEYPSADAGLNYADTPAAQGVGRSSFAMGAASGIFLSKGHGALRLLLCDALIIAIAAALLRTPAMWPARRQMRPPWIQIQRHGEWGIGNLELRELYRAIAGIPKDHKG